MSPLGLPTRSQLEAWKPGLLLTQAEAWRKTGKSVESLFTRYSAAVTQSHGSYWEGAAAESAQARAHADRKTAFKMVDALDHLAGIAEQGYHAINPHLDAAKNAISGAEAQGFEVSENFKVGDPASGQSSAVRDSARVEWEQRIADAVGAAYTADRQTYDRLNGQRAGLLSKFTDAGSLSGEQGRGDGKELMDHPGSLSAAEQQRLKEVGHLSPKQLADLQSGKTVTIPASQMEYINALSHSMDGKSPEEIKAAMDKMPRESRQALGNIFHIGSTKTVTASVEGNKDVPTNGGESVLPTKMRESLTRKDLVTEKWDTSSPYSPRTVSLNGVKDNQTIAAIAGAGDHRYQAGSDLDRSLASAGAKYLHAQVQAEQDPNPKFVGFEVDGRGQDVKDPITENIFSNISGDKNVVADMVNNPHTGMQFVTDIETHNWSDDGKAAATMFQFNGDKFGDPHQAEIMGAIGRASSSNEAWATLSAIPGTEGQSVGQVNPELLRTLSKSMVPYIPELAGVTRTPGFDSFGWADDGGGKYVGAANIFALMNTNHDVGSEFSAEALKYQTDLENAYGHDPDGPGSGARLVGAGHIQGLIDQGNYLAVKNEYGQQAAIQAYENKEQMFDKYTALLGYAASKSPAGEAEAGLGLTMGNDWLKNQFIGARPEEGARTDSPELFGPRENLNNWNILKGAGNLGPEVTQEYSWACNSDGTLKSYNEMRDSTTDNEMTDGLQKMVSRIRGADGMDEFYKAYNNVVSYRHDDK